MHHLILSRISKEIARGRPLAAMLMANEHLTPADPLRRALVSRAMVACKDLPSYRSVRREVQKVENGTRLHELTNTEETKLRGFREAARPLLSDRYIPRPILMQTRQGQLQRLRRVGR